MTNNEKLAALKDIIEDLPGNVLYYDRKEDEELKVGDIEQMIKDGIITKSLFLDLIVKSFSEAL